MSGWTIAWLIWLAAFVVVEVPGALKKKPGATLSEHIWSWFSVKDKGPHWKLRRVILALFLAGLGLHLTLGTTVLPVIVFGVAVALVIDYSTRGIDPAWLNKGEGGLMSLWNWLNGRKTALGLILVSLATLVQQSPDVAGLFGTHAIQAVQAAGWIVTLIGGSHKIIKGS